VRRRGEVKISEAVFVYIAGGDACRTWRSEAGLGCNVAERAITHVAPERDLLGGCDDEIDIAAVVEVSRHDRTSRGFVYEFCSSSLICKCLVAVVSQQQITVTGNHDVEIAIVIDIGEGCGSSVGWRRRNFGSRCNICKTSVAVVVIQR